MLENFSEHDWLAFAGAEPFQVWKKNELGVPYLATLPPMIARIELDASHGLSIVLCNQLLGFYEDGDINDGDELMRSIEHNLRNRAEAWVLADMFETWIRAEAAIRGYDAIHRLAFLLDNWPTETVNHNSHNGQTLVKENRRGGKNFRRELREVPVDWASVRKEKKNG